MERIVLHGTRLSFKHTNAKFYYGTWRERRILSTLRYMAQASALIDPDAAAGRINFNCQRANVIFLWDQSDPGFPEQPLSTGEHGWKALAASVLRIAGFGLEARCVFSHYLDT